MTEAPSHSEKKHAAIVEAAISEFHANGFLATSMDTIAASAGVSKRTIYNHFENKDELFSVISTEACRRVLEQPRAIYRADQSLDEQLRGIAEGILDLVGQPEFIRLVGVTLAERVRRPHIAAEAFAQIQGGEYGASDWIRAAAADGRLVVEDAARANKQFSALLKEFALWPQLFGTRPRLDRAERDQVIEDAVTIFLGRYRA